MQRYHTADLPRSGQDTSRDKGLQPLARERSKQFTDSILYPMTVKLTHTPGETMPDPDHRYKRCSRKNRPHGSGLPTIKDTPTADLEKSGNG